MFHFVFFAFLQWTFTKIGAIFASFPVKLMQEMKFVPQRQTKAQKKIFKDFRE